MRIILRALFFFRKQWRLLITRLLYVPSFKNAGKGVVIASPLHITGIRYISIGNDVVLGYKCWLAAGHETNNPNPVLSIGNGCRIGNYNHIYATDSVVIEDDVLTADKVYISDNYHSFDCIDVPVWKQPVKHKGNVVIGEGSWLGENVCVICANVGKHCVVGANSVVTRDIPDYSVAVGAPAKVIKQYNPEKKEWVVV